MLAFRRRSLLVVLLLLAGLAVVVAACGGGRQQPSSSERSGGTPPAASSSSSSPGGTAVTSGTATQAGEAQLTLVATDEGGRFRFEPDVVEVRPGERVTIKVINRGVSAHDLSISAVSAETGQLNPGDEKTLSFLAPSQPGEYEFICTVPGHAQLGMTGKMIVKR